MKMGIGMVGCVWDAGTRVRFEVPYINMYRARGKKQRWFVRETIWSMDNSSLNFRVRWSCLHMGVNSS